MSTSQGQSELQPLQDRNIVITRALAQAADFATALESFGARVIPCPTIEIVDPESFAPLDEAIDHLYGYDWLVFTSVNGVAYFLRRLLRTSLEAPAVTDGPDGADPREEPHRYSVSDLDDLRVCAIGDATAEALRTANVHVDVVPDEFNAEGVFAGIESFVGGRAALAGLSFLIPRAAVARSYLPDALEEAGARVDVIAAYRTVRPLNTELGRINALLSGGGVDCITFTSSSTVTNFAQLFDTSDLSALLKGVAVACIGDITAATASAHGLKTDIMPAEYTIPALAQAIASYFSR
ncbi:MAG: uroporphyrinogen methyltransferase / synthase [Blastocatellia bacterium]|nr:uroporphyrinogen methyltransferase / synthase [Blastocatellia bacterium]